MYDKQAYRKLKGIVLFTITAIINTRKHTIQQKEKAHNFLNSNT